LPEQFWQRFACRNSADSIQYAHKTGFSGHRGVSALTGHRTGHTLHASLAITDVAASPGVHT
jgi:hypothetical protein